MNNIALLIGATSDISRAFAHEIAQAGYTIYLAGRQTELLQRDAQDLQLRHHADVQVFFFDALQTDNHADFYDQLPQKPNLAVCFVGYLGDQAKAENDFMETQKILNTNLLGCVSILNIVANDFENRKTGTIVGVSSVAGERGRKKNYIYGAAKAGFTAYLSGLRNRLYSQKVHVLSVQPGFVATKMIAGTTTPPKLTAQPAQVAKDMMKAIKNKKNEIYTLWFWRYIMLIIKNIPESMFKKMSI